MPIPTNKKHYVMCASQKMYLIATYIIIYCSFSGLYNISVSWSMKLYTYMYLCDLQFATNGVDGPTTYESDGPIHLRNEMKCYYFEIESSVHR